jgi:hypothetical protein
MRPALVRCAIATALAAAFASDAAHATRLFLLTSANQLRRVEDTAPGTLVSAVAVTGLQPGEVLTGIDFRPADETMYGVGSTSRLYAIDHRTGVATVVTGADSVTPGPLSVPLAGTSFGVDFNPVADRIRVTSNTEQNLRLVPADGVAPAVDTTLAYAAGDPNFGANPEVTASAYTNNFNGALTTTLFGIDTSLDVLVAQNPPNGGTLNTVGPLGVNASATASFDILAGNAARAVLVVAGTAQLYAINLTTGAATLIGPVSATVTGMAAAPPGFTVALVGSSATFTGSAASQVIRFDSAGGLVRHDRYTAGDAGFNSDFDFDAVAPGDQILPANAGTISVNGLGGDDTVVIGSASAPSGAFGGALSFSIDGGGGHDVVRLDDSASVAARNYTLGGGSLIGLFGGVSDTSVESVEIVAGSGDDGFSIGTTTAATSLRAGGGADVFVFANNGTLSGGLLDGEAGTDTLDLSFYTAAVQFEKTAARELFLGRASGAQEPGPLSPSPGAGNVLATLDAGATALAFSLPYRDLTGASISGAHFHDAKAGINGAIVRDISAAEQNGAVLPAGLFTGKWANDDAQPLTAAMVAELRANRIYVNLHTAPNQPSGEIRGQLVAQGLVGLATGTGGVRNVEVLDTSLFANGFE